MDTSVPEPRLIPSSAQSIVDWIFGNSYISRDTLKEMLLSQQFPYIEDACLDYLRSRLLSSSEINEETLAGLRTRVISISSIRLIQNGFIKRATAVLDSMQIRPTESQ